MWRRYCSIRLQLWPNEHARKMLQALEMMRRCRQHNGFARVGARAQRAEQKAAQIVVAVSSCGLQWCSKPSVRILQRRRRSCRQHAVRDEARFTIVDHECPRAQ